LTFEELFYIKINARRYIGSSLRMYQDQTRLLVRHYDKLEDLFTTIKHRFLNFAHT